MTTPPRLFSSAGSAAVGLALAACSAAAGSGNFPTSVLPTMPNGAPTRFVPADSTKTLARADTSSAPPCISPMKDPGTGTLIVLVRSENGVGDYLAPSGSYGIPDGQLLRLECDSGEVLGLVRR
jgi:hypothetical protein